MPISHMWIKGHEGHDCSYVTTTASVRLQTTVAIPMGYRGNASGHLDTHRERAPWTGSECRARLRERGTYRGIAPGHLETHRESERHIENTHLGQVVNVEDICESAAALTESLPAVR